MKSNEERLTMSDGIILEEGDKFFETDIFTDEEEFIGEVVYDKDFEALIIVESNRAFCLTAKEFMKRHPRAVLIKKWRPKMEATNRKWFSLDKTLTQSDILDIAKEIGEIRKEIDEIEEGRKKLKGLQSKIVTLSRQLEQGKITGQFYGVHSYHDPEENMVTIRPDEGSWASNFKAFTREMNQYEKEKYCQHTIDFKEPEEEEDINLGIQITKENEELQEPIPNISVPVEPEQLSKVKVWKALNGGYFVFNEQQNPVPLKVLNSLENVVFLEQEGVDGVILKRHSEIIPSAINL